MQKAILKFVLILGVFALASFFNDVMAQCPMCRSAVESAMQNEGNTVGVGLNKGIMYLLAAPYLLVLTVGGYLVRRIRKNRHA